MEQIAVCVNQTKLLASLRYAFTNQYTVVTELLQNARRAKATSVAVDYDSTAQTLRVRDDGVGIVDWQKLFTVGESGWDAATARDEHAFGVGFMKSLYSARQCSVRSHDKMIVFATAEALQQRPIAVQAAPFTTGTVVTLEGVALPELERRMEVLASAFPIPVLYNGVALSRPLALDSKTFVATPIGQVHLAGTEDGKAVASTLLVLQGFAVHGDPRFDRDGNVVHLDPRQFGARLPDRDVLIDEAEAVGRVEAQLKAMWRALLIEAKGSLSSDAFISRYFDATVTWGATDLLSDVPLLPGRLFARISGYPIQEGYGDPRYLQALPGLVRQAQFASGELQAVVLPEPEVENFPYWMFAKAKGFIVFTRPWAVADNHWIWEHVREIEELRAKVEIVGERLRSRLDGQWITPDVVLCAAYRVGIDGDTAELTDQGMVWTGVGGDEELILVPDGESSGAAVEQCASYLDEDDHWRGESVDQDREALAKLILRLRSGDPTEALRSLLGELKLEQYPGLRGRTFSVQVAAERSAHEVRLVA